MTVSRRSARNRSIARARAGGASWQQIADEFGLSERQARRCAAEALQVTDMRNDSPEELLDLILTAQRLAVERLQDMTASRNESIVVGAARSLPAAAAALMETLVEVGAMPTNGGWKVISDARFVWLALMSAAARSGVDRSVVQQAFQEELEAVGASAVMELVPAAVRAEHEKQASEWTRPIRRT